MTPIAPLLALLLAAAAAPLTPLEPINLAAEPVDAAGARAYDVPAFATAPGDGYDSLHVRGFIRAPIAAVWRALQRPEVVTDHRKLDELHEVSRTAQPEQLRFVARSVLHALFTVEFDVEHRQAIVEGTAEAPRRVVGRWQKIAGTRFISLLDGSFVLIAVDEQTTELQIIEHCSAARTGIPQMTLFLGDLFQGAVLLAHGRPLPADYTRALDAAKAAGAP